MHHRIFSLRSLPTFLLALILLTNILIGSLVVADYGESWDEASRYDYAKRSLAAYTNGKRIEVEEKGPAYVMLARLGADALRAVWGELRPIEAWHFMHFLSFLIAIYFLYQICCWYMNQTAALGAALLFNTQPLLWGHAWINPKDIPFMAFFLGSVALGMQMVAHADVEERGAPSTNREHIYTLIGMDWSQASRRRRELLIGAAVFVLGLLLVLLLANTAIESWIAVLVTRAYVESDASALGRLFSRLAENTGSIPAKLYVQKGLTSYHRLVARYVAVVPVIWLICAALLLPQTWRRAWRAFIRSTPRSLLNWRLLLAAFFLGFASAIRTLGPASGLLVTFYGLAKRGHKTLPSLLPYFVLAGLVTVALWPELWRAPLQGYLSAINEASDYSWGGTVMFAGVKYSASELPRSYLPALMSMQFTEPLLVLFLLGFGLAARDFWHKKAQRPELALAALWLLTPLAVAVALMPNMYDNFRQFLFTVPPLFIFAGMGLNIVLEWLQQMGERLLGRTPAVRSAATLLVLAAVLLPGLYWDVSLHPYQYVYYNQLVGGVGGAFRRYEMDYWDTSYKEVAEYLNANAPARARIAVWGADHLVKRYAREDLVIVDLRKDNSPVDFAVVPPRNENDLELYPGAPVVFQVGRSGAIYIMVKRLDARYQP